MITCEHVQYLGAIFMIRHFSYITLLCFLCALKLRRLGTRLYVYIAYFLLPKVYPPPLFYVNPPLFFSFIKKGEKCVPPPPLFFSFIKKGKKSVPPHSSSPLLRRGKRVYLSLFFQWHKRVLASHSFFPS